MDFCRNYLSRILVLISCLFISPLSSTQLRLTNPNIPAHCPVMNSISALLLVFLLRPTQSLVINLPGETGPAYTCPGDGTFPDLESGCEEYYVCRAGRVGVIHQELQ